MNRGRAALISMLVIGGGQIYSGRIWAGVSFAIIFYGTVGLVFNIWTGINPAFWGLIVVWIFVWLFNIYDAYRGSGYEKPPCEKMCPAGIAPWVYINLIATGSNDPYPFVPFFNVLELICPAPCETQCTRRGIDNAVAIKYLKSDVKMQKSNARQKTKKERIAVIGAGPCGLSAAYSLASKGYNVTIFEREKRPGGVLAVLIPEFRLPQSLLDKEIRLLIDVGIELKCGLEVGKDISLDELLKNYDLVFIATGAWKSMTLDIKGKDAGLNGFDVLKKIKRGERFNLGKVGVIGGGDTAIDIARSLIRQGNKVKIYYRRRIEDMPAELENRTEAQEEGIEIIPLTVPIAIEDSKVTMAETECLESRKGPVRIKKECTFKVDLNHIIIAVGQQPDTDFLRNYVKIDKFGRIKTKHWKTSHPRIFAGGDAVLGSKTVAHAVGEGLNAAEHADFYLRRIHPLFGRIFKKIDLPRVKCLPVKNIGRMTIPHRKVEERIHDFEEVEMKASQEELRQEALRCLSCPLRYRP